MTASDEKTGGSSVPPQRNCLTPPTPAIGVQEGSGRGSNPGNPLKMYIKYGNPIFFLKVVFKKKVWVGGGWHPLTECQSAGPGYPQTCARHCTSRASLHVTD